MTESTSPFIDKSGHKLTTEKPWKPFKISRQEIEREIDRLANLPTAPNGRRYSVIVHPESTLPGLGFSPGVDITINVLKPGEMTQPVLRNSSQVEICIRGSGTVIAGPKEHRLTKWDVCNIPSMQPYYHHNTGDDLWVRLSYSNAPLLEKLRAHYIEEYTDGTSVNQTAKSEVAQRDEHYTRLTAPDIAINGDGARLRGYEFLTDIQVVENKSLLWPWKDVSSHLSQTYGDGKRTIILLYNPATERRNGTTHNFFATISSMPAGTPQREEHRGHRHSSVAINYHFLGSGRSVVDGETIEWSEGDLLLSAPSWSEHAHYVGPNGLGVLTIQDHPLHIGMESLIWQERMDGPILNLGAEAGQTGFVGPRLEGS